MFHITCVDKFKLLNVNPTTQPDITANTDKVSKPFLLQKSVTHSRNFGDIEFLIRFLKYFPMFLKGLTGGEWHWEDAGLELLRFSSMLRPVWAGSVARAFLCKPFLTTD